MGKGELHRRAGWVSMEPDAATGGTADAGWEVDDRPGGWVGGGGGWVHSTPDDGAENQRTRSAGDRERVQRRRRAGLSAGHRIGGARRSIALAGGAVAHRQH